MDLVALIEKEPGQIVAVLPDDPAGWRLLQHYRPSKAAGIVRARILTSSHNDQRSM
jgi:hypothetical protein